MSESIWPKERSWYTHPINMVRAEGIISMIITSYSIGEVLQIGSSGYVTIYLVIAPACQIQNWLDMILSYVPTRVGLLDVDDEYSN